MDITTTQEPAREQEYTVVPQICVPGESMFAQSWCGSSIQNTSSRKAAV